MQAAAYSAQFSRSCPQPQGRRGWLQARRHGSPRFLLHRLRHFLFTWLKTQGIDDALIQPYSGHASRQSLEVYSRIALADAQHSYEPRRS